MTALIPFARFHAGSSAVKKLPGRSTVLLAKPIGPPSVVRRLWQNVVRANHRAVRRMDSGGRALTSRPGCKPGVGDTIFDQSTESIVSAI